MTWEINVKEDLSYFFFLSLSLSHPSNLFIRKKPPAATGSTKTSGFIETVKGLLASSEWVGSLFISH